MKQILQISLLILLFSGGCSVEKSDFQQEKKKIIEIMELQETAWNKGDLEGFMQGYWKSDSLKFIGKSGLTYGWGSTLENYKRSYPDKDAMGTLNFEIISVEKMCDDAAFLVGKWRLDRKTDTLGGHYSLTWKKIKNKWVIVADHSS